MAPIVQLPSFACKGLGPELVSGIFGGIEQARILTGNLESICGVWNREIQHSESRLNYDLDT
jgi:hypothetical protein